MAEHLLDKLRVSSLRQEQAGGGRRSGVSHPARSVPGYPMVSGALYSWVMRRLGGRPPLLVAPARLSSPAPMGKRGPGVRMQERRRTAGPTALESRVASRRGGQPGPRLAPLGATRPSSASPARYARVEGRSARMAPSVQVGRQGAAETHDCGTLLRYHGSTLGRRRRTDGRRAALDAPQGPRSPRRTSRPGRRRG